MLLDPKTVRAVILADLFAFLFIGAIAWFLGFEPVPSLIAGAVAGFVSGGIVLGAAMRARHLGTDQPTTPSTDEDDRG